MDHAIAPSSIEPSASIYRSCLLKVKRNHQTKGICKLGNADYTERIRKNHVHLLKNNQLKFNTPGKRN